MALSAWRALGCSDGGRVDVRSNERGEPQFLEVNPLAGLRPGYSDLVVLAQMHGVSYEELIGMILDSFEDDLAQRRPPFEVDEGRAALRAAPLKPLAPRPRRSRGALATR